MTFAIAGQPGNFDEGSGMTTTSKCGGMKGQQLEINAAKWTPAPFF